MALFDIEEPLFWPQEGEQRNCTTIPSIRLWHTSKSVVATKISQSRVLLLVGSDRDSPYQHISVLRRSRRFINGPKSLTSITVSGAS